MEMRRPSLIPLFRFLRTLGMLMTGTLLSAALAFLTQIMLTRQVRVDDVGVLAAVLATVNFLTPIATGGINYFILQAAGREGPAATRWLRPAAGFGALTMLLSAVLLALYMLRGLDGQAPAALPILAGLAILAGQSGVEFAASCLQLRGRYAVLSAWQGVTQIGRFLVLASGLCAGASVDRLLLLYAVVGLATTGLGIPMLRGLGRAIAAQPLPVAPSAASRASLWAAAQGSVPFALMTMFYVFYFQWPIVILEWLRGGAAAAAYNAAFLIIAAMSLIPNVVYMKFLLPKICRWAEHDRSVYSATLHVGVPAMLLSGLGLMIAIMVAAPLLLPAVFGPAYAAGVPALRILAWTVPVRFVQSAYSALFIKATDMNRKVRYLGSSAVVGGTASLLLIPPFGLQGAAMATLAAELCLLGLHVVGTSRFMDGINILDTFRPRIFRMSLRHLLQEFQTER